MCVDCRGMFTSVPGSSPEGLRPVVSLINGVVLEESGDGSDDFYVPCKRELG